MSDAKTVVVTEGTVTLKHGSHPTNDARVPSNLVYNEATGSWSFKPRNMHSRMIDTTSPLSLATTMTTTTTTTTTTTSDKPNNKSADILEQMCEMDRKELFRGGLGDHLDTKEAKETKAAVGPSETEDYYAATDSSIVSWSHDFDDWIIDNHLLRLPTNADQREWRHNHKLPYFGWRCVQCTREFDYPSNLCSHAWIPLHSVP